jgi:predicted RNA-binding protein associated with RNAse of E/G family
MKRKSFKQDEWKVITAKRYKQITMDDKCFKGIAALLYIDEVTTPQIWQFKSEDIVVCADGMKWLQLLPIEGTYVITAMLNSQNEIELWYIDMIGGYGLDNDIILYMDDLYLDLIVFPDGTIKVDDMDELVEAYENNIINTTLYQLALNTSEELQLGILSDISKLTKLCRQCLSKVEVEEEFLF